MAEETKDENVVGALNTANNQGNNNDNKPKTTVEAPDLSAQFAALDKVAQLYSDAQNEFQIKSKAQLDAERKRFKRNKIVSALGDGISAIANMVGTANYAPNMYTGNKLSDAAQARYDRMVKDYDDRKANYLKAADGKAKVEQERAKLMQQNWKDKLEMQLKSADNDRKDELNKSHIAVNDSQIGYNQQRTATEAQRTDKAATEAEYAERQEIANLNKKQSDINRNNSATNLNNTRADKETRGKVCGTLLGKEYTNSRDYDKAVVDEAQKLGIPLKERKNVLGEEMRRPIRELAAEVERVAAERAAEDEMNSYKRK
jgi:hypothetical protein